MPTVRGRREVKAMIERLPGELEEKVLRGAVRAGAKVVADEAKDRCASDVVKEAVVMRSSRGDGELRVKITVKPGWPRSIGTWLEYGTDPHIISVADDRDRQGMSIRRINQVQKAGTLVIGGKPVGKVVEHPGARPHPFLRPALDAKEREAIATAQSYINARVRPGGIVGSPEPQGGNE